MLDVLKNTSAVFGRSLMTALAAVFLSTQVMVGFAMIRAGIVEAYNRSQNSGATVTYFSDTSFGNKYCTRNEGYLVKDYGVDAPVIGLSADGFSARWECWLICPSNAVYYFYSQAEDGVRLRVDGVLVIDNWKENDWYSSGTHYSTNLAAGPHRLQLDYYKGSGSGAVRLKWAGGGIPANTVVGRPYIIKELENGRGLDE